MPRPKPAAPRLKSLACNPSTQVPTPKQARGRVLVGMYTDPHFLSVAMDRMMDQAQAELLESQA